MSLIKRADPDYSHIYLVLAKGQGPVHPLSSNLLLLIIVLLLYMHCVTFHMYIILHCMNGNIFMCI